MSYVGLGIAQGAADVQKHVQGQELRELQLTEARQRQQQSKAQFDTSQAAAATSGSVAKEQLEQMQMQTRQMQQELFKRDMYDSFRLYDADRDTKHLNNLVKSAKVNPAGQKLFANVTRADQLSDTPDHRKLVQQYGINDFDGLIADKKLASNFFVSTDNKGQQTLVDVPLLYAGTGYTKYMKDEELKVAQQQALVTQRLRSGTSVSKSNLLEKLAQQMAEDLDIPLYEAYKRLEQGDSKTGSSAAERLAKSIQEENPDLSYLEAYEQGLTMSRAGSEVERTAKKVSEQEGRDYTEVLRELQTEKQRTSSQKDATAAKTARQELDKAFGGQDKYFSANMADPANRRKAQDYVNEIEKLADKPLTSEDKRAARQMRTLTALGANAGEGITGEEAGPLDTLLRDTKSYFYDELGGNKEAVAAYEAFRNVARNALFGASLTGNETAAFDKAMGKMSQQTGPILSKLKVQMENIKNDMQAIYDFNDEHVAHFYLGKGLGELDDSILAIEDRLKMLQRTTKAATVDGSQIMVNPKPVAAREPGAPRPALSDILGGRN